MTDAPEQAPPPGETIQAPTPPTQEVRAEEPFSWLKPHPIFVIILVGPDEQPFGIQKDFLCHRSQHFRKYFAESAQDKVEHIVKLPDVTAEIFGLAQNFLFTGKVASGDGNEPSYESLVGLWKLGHSLIIEGLCESTLKAMKECRRLTQRIPSTPLLVQVWRDTPEGSAIRTLLLSWAAEYMRSSTARAEFAKSLPQEVLSELVVTMSSFEESAKEPTPDHSAPGATPTANGNRKNVHYLDPPSDDESLDSIKRSRRTSGGPVSSADHRTGSLSRKTSRGSLSKPQKRRSGGNFLDGRAYSTPQKLDFCADLLARMLSGPGFWTRLVGPFKEPVVPEEDGVPDYFDKVKRPMDLSTIKGKMDRREYTSDEEFLADMRQIFDNCFAYWKKGDPIWLAGEKLQKTFEEKYAGMNKWISKTGGEDAE